MTLLVHQNTGKENRYRKFFFAIRISILRRFNRKNKKKICHIHFNEDPAFGLSLLELFIGSVDSDFFPVDENPSRSIDMWFL